MADKKVNVTIDVKGKEKLDEANKSAEKLDGKKVSPKVDTSGAVDAIKKISTSLEDIGKNPIKVKLDTTDLEQFMNVLNEVKANLQAITGRNADNRKIALNVEGIDKLLGKLGDLEHLLGNINDAFGIKNLGSPELLKSQLDHFTALKKGADEAQKSVSKLYDKTIYDEYKDAKGNVHTDKRENRGGFWSSDARNYIDSLFGGEKEVKDMSQKIIGYINDVKDAGIDLSDKMVGKERGTGLHSLLDVFDKINESQISAITKQIEDLTKAGDVQNVEKLNAELKKFQDMSAKMHSAATFGAEGYTYDQIARETARLQTDYKKAQAMASTAVRTEIGSESIENLIKPMSATLDKLSQAFSDVKFKGGEFGIDTKSLEAITSSVTSVTDEIRNISTSITEFMQPLQGAEPIPIKVDASDALRQLQSVQEAITSLKEEPIELEVDIKNKEELNDSLGKGIKTNLESSLAQMASNSEKAFSNISTTISSITSSINEVAQTVGQAADSFSKLDSSIGTSGDKAGKLVDSISKLNETQNTAPSYVASPIENVEKLTSAYETMNKAISETEQAQKRLTTLSSTTTDANGNKVEIDYATQLADLEGAVSKVHNAVGKLKQEIADIQSGFKDIDLSGFGKSTKQIVSSLESLSQLDGIEAKVEQLGEAIKKLNDNSQGLDGANLNTVFSSFNIDVATPDKILNLAVAFEELRNVLQGFGTSGSSDLTGVINSINQLLQSSENLKTLADVLKSSESKIREVREATKTQEEKDYETETKKMQAEAYKELTEAVKQYVSAAKEVASGNKDGKFDTAMLKDYRENVDRLSESLKNNARLYDETKQAQAMSPMNNLDEDLRKINVANIAKDTREALQDAESFIKQAEKYSADEGIAGYLSQVKTKADEVRVALQQMATGEITGKELGNIGKELADLVNAYQKELDKVASTKAWEGNQDIKGTGITSIFSKAQQFAQANAGTEVDGFKNKIDDLNVQLEKTNQLMRQIDPKNLSKEDLSKISDQAKALNESYKAAQDAMPVNEERRNKALASFDTWVSKNSVAAAKYGDEIQNLRTQMTEAATEVDFSNANAQVQSFIARVTEAGDVGQTFGEKLQRSFSSLGRYLMSYVSFYRIIGALKEGINIAKEFDKAMTSIKMVSDETGKTYENMQKTSFDIASQIGGDALTIQKSMGTWLRLGKSIEESQEAAKASNWLVNVSEFDNIDDASTALVSIKQAYDDLGYEDILDKLNAVGDSFSSSTDALAQGLQNSAAALVTQGNDIDQALALLTAGNNITQDISKTAAGVRTISLKIAGVLPENMVTY